MGLQRDGHNWSTEQQQQIHTYTKNSYLSKKGIFTQMYKMKDSYQ